MIALLRLFFDLATLRRGPESAPSAPVALVITAALMVVMSIVLDRLMPKPDPSLFLKLAVNLGFTLLWYRALLTFSGKGERYVQTLVAVIGYQIVIMPFLGAVEALGSGAAKGSAREAAVAFVFLGLLAWSLTVNTRIVQAALERPVWVAGLLVVAEFMTQLLLLAAMFGQPPTA